jgi:hypothetical protein
MCHALAAIRGGVTKARQPHVLDATINLLTMLACSVMGVRTAILLRHGTRQITMAPIHFQNPMVVAIPVIPVTRLPYPNTHATPAMIKMRLKINMKIFRIWITAYDAIRTVGRMMV